MLKTQKQSWYGDVLQRLKKYRLFRACIWLNVLTAALCCFLAAWFLLRRRGELLLFALPPFLLLVLITMVVNIRCFFAGIARPYQRIVNADTEPNGRRLTYADELLALIEQLNGTKERNKNYQLLQKQAQINALQQQINPHFLYNSLDSVRGLAYSENAKKTADMVEALAIFFRYTIGGKNDLVPLTDELQGIRNYLKIQQYRYKNPFQIHYQIDLTDDQALRTMLPRLTLQPIVENAIKHGLLYMKPDAELLIKLIPTQSRLIISIIDNGSGISDQVLREINEKLKRDEQIHNESDKQHGSGIALQNINARIKLHFGNEYGLSVFSTLGIGTEVQIVIPLLLEKTIHD